MERIFIFIKHHFIFLWTIIDWINGKLFQWFFKSDLETVLPFVIEKYHSEPFFYRKLHISDITELFKLIESQPREDLKYFSPHRFDITSLNAQIKKPAFLMMGTFADQKMVGYFFLRFFANRKCFVGRLIDKEYRGKGIGYEMNKIMYNTAWEMGFRCLSTISKNNKSVMGAHAKNSAMIVLKELQNDYLLVEFIDKKK